MQAQVTIGTGESIAMRDRGSCLTPGCPCKDPRIVSPRRAAFFAAMARRSGETADRIVAVEPAWRMPWEGVARSTVELHGTASA